MKKIYSLAVALLLLQAAYAQDGTSSCGTEVMPVQKEYLDQFREDRASFSADYFRGSVRMVPVKVHIVTKSDGTGGLEYEELMNEMAHLNKKFKNGDIQFYMCGDVNYIASDSYYEFRQNMEAKLAVPHDVEGAVNLYFVNSIKNGQDMQICGYTYLPNGKDRIFISNACTFDASTLAHEMGHYLSLYHTHGVAGNDPELANGTNCYKAGDEVCDTPADPNINGLINMECEYVGTKIDPAGNPYKPDTRNIMSYANGTCRDHFTSQQFDRMLFSLINDRSYLSCSDTFATEFAFYNPEDAGNVTVQVYPNPSTGQFNIDVERSNDESITVSIYNITGQKMEEFTAGDMATTIPVDITGFEKGIYFVNILTGRKMVTEKVIYQ